MNKDIDKKNIMVSICLLILLALTFMLAGGRVSAAETGGQEKASGPQELKRLKKTPYIKDQDTVVLRFADFSDDGYSYTLTSTESGKSCSGTLSSGKGLLTVNLKSNHLYSDGCGYVLELVSKDRQKKVTTRYYTTEALQDIVISQTADKGLLYKWKVSDKKAYSGFLAFASRKKDSSQPELYSFSKKGSVKIPASKLSLGIWYASGVAYRLVGHYRYYGERIIKKITITDSVEKVSGLSVTEGAHSALLSWNKVDKASWYTVYYRKAGGKMKLCADYVSGTTYKATGLKSEKKYYFAVRAVCQDGNINRIGPLSQEDGVKTPDAAADIRKIVPAYNDKSQLSVKWKEVKGARQYRVYARKTGTKAYKLLGKTKETLFSLNGLDGNTSYDIVAYTVSKDKGKTYRSPEGSNVLTLTPNEYEKTHQTQLLASRVRTIKYRPRRNSAEYTKKKYPKEVKLAYVNYKGFTSKTSYLIWVSHYTQQATIFKGSKGKWKIIRSFTVGTGRARSRSPRGIFKIFRKESGWYYNYTMELYVSHYRGRNSFHTRPLYRGGGVATSTIGRPCSHGCVRCYNQDARFIYKKIPIGTTVVSY